MRCQMRLSMRVRVRGSDETLTFARRRTYPAKITAMSRKNVAERRRPQDRAHLRAPVQIIIPARSSTTPRAPVTQLFYSLHHQGFVRVAACTPKMAVADPDANAAETLALM